MDICPNATNCLYTKGLQRSKCLKLVNKVKVQIEIQEI